MSLSSFCVVTNALRLNLFNMYDAKRDKKRRQKKARPAEAAASAHTRVMEIEGMMCEHCEATVTKALLSVAGVISAEVSHVKGTAIVAADPATPDSALQKAVEDADYQVLSIRAL